MFGLVVIEVMTPSGHLSNINEIKAVLSPECSKRTRTWILEKSAILKWVNI